MQNILYFPSNSAASKIKVVHLYQQKSNLGGFCNQGVFSFPIFSQISPSC